MLTAIGIFAIIILYIVSVYNALAARHAQIKMVQKSIIKNIQSVYTFLNLQYNEINLMESIDKFKNLMTNNPDKNELNDIKNKIKSDIEFYNRLCSGLNSQLETFPTNIIAKWFHVMPQAMITNGDF